MAVADWVGDAEAAGDGDWAGAVGMTVLRTAAEEQD